MPITQPTNGSIETRTIGNLAPIQVLDEDVVVRLWVVENEIGQQMLAYLAEENSDSDWIILSPCGPAVVSGLENGSIALRDAVVGTWMWLVRRPHQGELRAWSVQESDVPNTNLPKAGVRLRLEHTPALATRAVGDMIGRGTTPASVVAWVADATRKSVKVIVDYLLDNDSGGRPTNEARFLYDLPVQTIAFRSFEIGFGVPEAPESRSNVHEAVELLQSGFDWLAAEGDSPLLSGQPPAKRIAVLAALKTLSPPKHGPIKSVEVGGLWMRRVGRLDQAARAKLQRELDAIPSEKPVTFVGRIRELDRDRGTFTLRDLSDRPEVKGVISLDTWDQFIEYFNTEEQVAVIGVLRNARFYAQAIGSVPQANAVEIQSSE